VYLVGTPELAEEFSSSGTNLDKRCSGFVVLGFDTTLTYSKLQTACQLITDGVCYLATHPDINCPTEAGYIPDCGSMMALVQASTGKLPKVIGKPNKEIIEAAFSRKPYSARQMAMVGDRLYTDMATAKNAGITGILVLSGETKQEHLAQSPIQPDYVFANLGELAYRLRQTE